MFKSTMFKLSYLRRAFLACAVLFGSMTQAEPMTGLGKPITDAELVNWDISVFFDGEGLPDGSGTLEQGEAIWGTKCAMCHGDFGEGVRGYPKMMGADLEEFQETAINNGFNVENRGLNNMWAHAPTLYDMIRRAMPYFLPQSLSADESYAITGYTLYLAEIIEDDVELIDADFLRNLEMPAANLFYTDTRPDVQNTRCMTDCFEGELDVTGKLVQGDFSGGNE